MSVVVVATIIPLPEYRDEVIATITETVAKVHEEDGCELYALHQADDRLMMVEKWASSEALRAHSRALPWPRRPPASRASSPGRPRSSSCRRCRPATRPRDSCEETGMSPAAHRVALVTGAARGIGAATVAALAAGGWRVVAVDRCADDTGLPYSLGSRGDLDRVVAAACANGRAARRSSRHRPTPATPTPWPPPCGWPRNAGAG